MVTRARSACSHPRPCWKENTNKPKEEDAMSITQGLKRAMQINRHGTATIFGQRRRTWQEFGQRGGKLAGAVRGLGLAAEGRGSPQAGIAVDAIDGIGADERAP